MNKLHPVRRVFRALNRLTLSTLNASPYDNPYTGNISRVMSGPRVF